MKKETVAEFLNRGGQISKVAEGKREKEPTALNKEIKLPAFYEMDCDTTSDFFHQEVRSATDIYIEGESNLKPASTRSYSYRR